MDGKAKKRLEVIKQKLHLLQQKLAGAKRQDDEPGEVRNLEQEIAALQAFAAQIQAGDLLAAGRTLAMLFDVEEPRAVACAATFAQRVRHEAAFFHKVMELRSELHSSNPQRALLLLLDCFGLSRGESAEILRNLQRRRRVG